MRALPLSVAQLALMLWPRLRALDTEADAEDSVEEVLETSEDVDEASEELVEDDDVPSSANAGIAPSASAAIREQDVILCIVFGERN